MTGVCRQACLIALLRTILAALSLLAHTGAVTAQSMDTAAPLEGKRVLLLPSYHQGDELWTDRMVEGVQTVLSTSGAALSIEYLDAGRNRDAAWQEIVKSALAHKYRNDPPHVIITTDDPALDFLLQHRESLFPDTPVVFCGVNNFKPERVAGHENITGVNENLDIAQTLEFALRLQPEAKSLVAITSDRQPHWRANAKAFRELLPLYSDQLEFREISNLEMTDAAEVLATIPPDSIVLGLTTELVDEGKPVPRTEFYRFVGEHSAAPVYTLWYFGSGTGLLGGKLVSGFHQGEAAAHLASRILSGEPASSIPVVMQSPNVPMFDWNAMTRFEIPEERLPAESVVLFKRLSFYEQYWVWFWVVPALIVLQSILLAGLLINRSVRLRIEGSLRKHEARLSDALSMGLMAHWEYDVAGDLFTFNDQFYRILRTSVDQVGGYDMSAADYASRFLHPDDAAMVGDEIRKAVAAADPEYSRELEYRMMRGDGTTGYVSVRFSIVKDDDGRTVSAHGVNQDITRQRQSEEERKKITLELEKQNEELEHYAYSVSHDLKSPLVTISGFIGLLERDLAANDQVRINENLANIKSAAETMGKLLNDVLEHSRIGRVISKPEHHKVSELASAALDLVRARIDERGVEVTLDDMPQAKVDGARLVEVYQNLIENGIKFMGKQENPRIHIGVVERDETPCFYVEDNGIGLKPEYTELIFGLFERLSANVEGTGIGLALVKRIIEVHGGKVWAESEGPGLGSRILFTLPQA